MQQNGLDLDLKFCLRIFVLGVERGEKNDYTFQKVSVGQCPGGKHLFFLYFCFFLCSSKTDSGTSTCLF